jgi:hypothetical protein
MQRRMRRTSEPLSFLTVWWCRRLLMQVEEIAAEPAETALPVFDKSFWQQ